MRMFLSNKVVTKAGFGKYLQTIINNFNFTKALIVHILYDQTKPDTYNSLVEAHASTLYGREYNVRVCIPSLMFACVNLQISNK